ncbi:MAG: histidine phosphatase family protein [Mycobacterium sp.]|nr:histidine phosphatase family protein [Mycobacterium sp.]
MPTAPWVKRLTIFSLTLAMCIASPITAWAATSITLTWVRHGQSVENVYHVLGSVAPGPDLSNCAVGATPCVDQPDAVPGPHIQPGFTQTAPGGVQQAQGLVQRLIDTGVAYDAIYASTLVRTQQTAQPYSDYSGLAIAVLDGLREVRAGADENAITTFENGAFVDPKMANYVGVMDSWRLGRALKPMPQDPNPIDTNPATNANGDVNGLEFNDRTNTAVEKIYWDEMNKYPTFTADSLNPDANPLAFSHNGTVASWVEMNVKNPLTLAYITENLLGNTQTAVVVGNPTDGWTLVSWMGVPVSPNPTLGMAFFVTLRDYGFVLQASAWNVQVARTTGDIGQVLQAVGTGIAQDLVATVALPGQLVHDVANAVVHAINPKPASAVKPARAVPAARAVAARSGATVTPISPPRTSFAVRAAAATAKHPPATGTSAPAAASRARQAA